MKKRQNSDSTKRRATARSFVASAFGRANAISWRRGVVLTVVALLLLATWWWVLPPNMGGRTTFFVTKGVSMEPLLHNDDLAVLQKKRTYEVGDVIAFRSQSLKSVLLHRVVAVEDGRYVTKGDNNDFIDNDRPRNDQVVGMLAHKFNGAGASFGWLKSTPVRVLASALICVALFGYLYSMLFARRKTPEGEPASKPGPAAVPAARARRRRLPNFPVLQWVPVLATAIGVAFMAISFVMPSTETGSTARYKLDGRLDYSAQGAPGAELIYASGRAETGEPLYFSVINDVHFDYAFDVITDSDTDLNGTFDMQAVLTGPSGWRHTLELTPPTQFEGDSFRGSAEIRLNDVRDLVSRIQSVTNLKESKFTLSVEPRVSLHGEVAGGEVNKSMSTPVVFNADAQMLKMEGDLRPGTEPTVPPGFEVPPAKNESSVAGAVKIGAVERASTGIAIVLRWTGIGLVGIAVGLFVFGRTRRRDAKAANLDAEAIIGYQNLLAQASHRAPTARFRFGIVNDEPEDADEQVQPQ